MRIKHWAGYGCVNATKISTLKGTHGKDSNMTIVKVSGNHECGLERPFNDPFCISRWLGKFMPKGDKLDYYDVIDSGFERIDDISYEYAIYRLVSYKEDK